MKKSTQIAILLKKGYEKPYQLLGEDKKRELIKNIMDSIKSA